MSVVDSDEQCTSVKECDYLSKLCDIIKQYVSTNGKAESLQQYEKKMIDIMDYFHHHIEVHYALRNDFEYIYHQFGGPCEATKCAIFQRYLCHTTNTTQKLNNRQRFVQETLDMIHCQISHQYDFGTRLRPNEQDEVDKGNTTTITILRNRRCYLKTQFKYTRYTSHNKYVSDLNQIKRQHSGQKCYSFSFPFNYQKEQCENLTEPCWNGLSYKDLYVPPKYSDLKNELAHHGIDLKKQLTPSVTWIKGTKHSRNTKANKANYLPKISSFPDHPSKFDYEEGFPLSKYPENIAVLRIYCGNDGFQKKFTETYRAEDDNKDNDSKTDNENDIFLRIKSRHSAYHHFAKKLKETVEVFGQQYLDIDVAQPSKVHERMYHGISGDMVIPGFQCKIFGVLSTTIKRHVAINFASSRGLVLELVPSVHLKFFDARFYSPYTDEGEDLFIGGLEPFNIMNIERTAFVEDLRVWITALRIIDCMTNGVYFSNDAADILKVKAKEWKILRSRALGFKDVDENIKDLVKELMNYRLDNKKANVATEFVRNLLDVMCDTKKCVIIHWESMDNELLRNIDVNGGYVGYLFLKETICEGKSSSYPDIGKLCTIFPSMRTLVILEMRSIETIFLKDILKNIEKEQSEINNFELVVSSDPRFRIDVNEPFRLLTQQFKCMKTKCREWEIFTEFDKHWKTDKIVIRQIVNPIKDTKLKPSINK